MTLHNITWRRHVLSLHMLHIHTCRPKKLAQSLSFGLSNAAVTDLALCPSSLTHAVYVAVSIASLVPSN